MATAYYTFAPTNFTDVFTDNGTRVTNDGGAAWQAFQAWLAVPNVPQVPAPVAFDAAIPVMLRILLAVIAGRTSLATADVRTYGAWLLTLVALIQSNQLGPYGAQPPIPANV
jgi:hypothetical protein